MNQLVFLRTLFYISFFFCLMCILCFHFSWTRIFRLWISIYPHWRFSAVNLKFKICVFKATVLSVLFSAVIVFVLSKTEFKKLSICYYAMCRKLLQGEACSKIQNDEGVTTKYKSLTNTVVCKKLSLCAISTELRIRRLTFLQSMLKHPEVHHVPYESLWAVSIREQFAPKRK